MQKSKNNNVLTGRLLIQLFSNADVLVIVAGPVEYVNNPAKYLQFRKYYILFTAVRYIWY